MVSGQIGLRHVSYGLNSFKGGYIGDYMVSILRLIKADTRNLGYSSGGLGTLGFRVRVSDWRVGASGVWGFRFTVETVKCSNCSRQMPWSPVWPHSRQL